MINQKYNSSLLASLFKDTQPQRYLARMTCHFTSCRVKMDHLQFHRNWLRQDNTKRRSYCIIQFPETLNRHVKEKNLLSYRPPIIL